MRRIAFISYEYAGTARVGGIGTYVRNAATMLAARGHDVHVFTAGENRVVQKELPNLTVHFISAERQDFSAAVVPEFKNCQESVPFDVIEGPEYKADAIAVASAFPEVPLVVKVHGPTFTVDQSNAKGISALRKARFFAGAMRRARWPRSPWRYDPVVDLERHHALSADLIVANSEATAARISSVWCVPSYQQTVVRYPFEAPRSLVEIDPERGAEVVLFLGRLEMRKGVLDLARAIPEVIKARPTVRFRFVGGDLPHPNDGRRMSEHILQLAGKCRWAVEIVGPVRYEEVPTFFRDVAICVFPSDWEASGFVCLEGMAAARAVIGSSSGGMAEIITDGQSGLLVPPGSPQAIADSVLALFADPRKRVAMGRAARAHVTTAYAPEVIGPLQEAAYEIAIARARARISASCLYDESSITT